MAKKRTIRTIPQQRTPVREQDPAERVKNFSEVSRGYTQEDALVESERCLRCPDQPCVRGCPVGIDIPGFIEKLGQKDFRGAYDVITATNLLPAVCGRVCPQENQCEGVCTVGDSLEPVAIGRLERFVGDRAIAEGWTNVPYIERNDFRVGIVGSGPAGMACAADMAKAGCDVTVYEAFHQAGGVLKYGIPDFRLPNDVVDAEIRNLGQPGRQVRMQHAGRSSLHDRADDRRTGIPRGLHRNRGGLSGDARHSRGLAQRRALRQRTPDALQPDAREGFPGFRHAAAGRPTRGRRRCGQYGDGRDARVLEARREEGLLRLSAQSRRVSGAHRGSPPCRTGRGRISLADQSGRGPRRRQRRGPRHALRSHGTGRARRIGTAAPDRRGGQRA